MLFKLLTSEVRMLKLVCETQEYMIYEDDESTYEIWIKKEKLQ